MPRRWADRIREAMDGRIPPLTGAELADACDVTPQAVSGWRKHGRIHKRHLETLAEKTGKALEYFLGGGKSNGHLQSRDKKDSEAFATVQRAWHDSNEDQRDTLLALATSILERNAKRRRRRAI
jgi:hypothetical protein